MDEHLYRALKQLEASTQGLLFTLPQDESSLWNSLHLDGTDSWKIHALVEHLIWLEKKTKSAAVSVYMQGKE